MDRELLNVLELRLSEPNARGLVAAVTSAIRDGVLMPGTRLPPIRTVGAELGLSPTTVSSAWALLGRSGAVVGAGRRGTVITDVRGVGAQRYQRALQSRVALEVDLSTGVPDPLLLPDLGGAMSALMATTGTPASYLDDPVLPELAATIAEDWPYRAAALTITDGAMDALELIARTLLNYGDRVVVEHPVFPPLLDLLDSIGVQTLGVRLDSHGIMPAELHNALAARPTAVILQPRAQNPTGVSTTAERAEELAGALDQSNVLVIEDDSAGAISAAPAISLGTWLPDRTLHVRSYSKSHGPDLRLAAVSGPTDLIGRLDGRRQLGQGWSSRLLQRILLHLLTDSACCAQVNAARAEYVRRREYAVQRLTRAGVKVGGDDGINLWVPVADEAATLVRLASQGIAVAPGVPFFSAPEHQGHIRVTIAAITPKHDHIVQRVADAAASVGSWTRAR